MATNLQIGDSNYNDVIPNPNAPGARTPIGGLMHAISRALGGNQLTGGSIGPDGRVSPLAPAHPTVDALLNRGAANTAAFTRNQQLTSHLLAQQHDLAKMKADTENQIALGNNVAENQRQLVHLTNEEARINANLAQINNVASTAGVVAHNPSDNITATPGMSALADAGVPLAKNVATEAANTAGILADPSVIAAQHKGAEGAALTPLYSNARQQMISAVPGGATYIPSPTGAGGTTLLGGGQSSQEQSIGQSLDANGNLIPARSMASSKMTQGSVIRPVDPSIRSSILGGSNGSTGNQMQLDGTLFDEAHPAPDTSAINNALDQQATTKQTNTAPVSKAAFLQSVQNYLNSAATPRKMDINPQPVMDAATIQSIIANAQQQMPQDSIQAMPQSVNRFRQLLGTRAL